MEQFSLHFLNFEKPSVDKAIEKFLDTVLLSEELATKFQITIKDEELFGRSVTSVTLQYGRLSKCIWKGAAHTAALETAESALKATGMPWIIKMEAAPSPFSTIKPELFFYTQRAYSFDPSTNLFKQ